MRATCFLLVSITGLCACLDFDTFRTEPTTGSTTSAGGAGGAGGGTTTATTTTTATGMGGEGGMGGMGGMGGSPPVVPTCGGYADDFDGMNVDLMWDSQGQTSFANDRAIAAPPNGSFWFWDDPNLMLDECAISIDVAVDTSEVWFFGWTDFTGNVFRVLRNQQKELHVIVSGGSPGDVIVATGVTTSRVRIREAGGDYLVETAALASSDWTLQHTLPAAMAPAWLTQPGYAWFGAQGAGSGTDVEFDNFGAP